MEKKYELIKSKVTCGSYRTRRPLYRIKALRDFDDVHMGDIGGFVESEDNLSHYGNCWIYNDGKVYDHAIVMDNAKVYGKSEVSGRAHVNGNAKLLGTADVNCDAFVGGHAIIKGNSAITGHAVVEDDAIVNRAVIRDNVHICKNAKVSGIIDGHSHFGKDAVIRASDDYMDIYFKIIDEDSPYASTSPYYTFYKSSKKEIMLTRYDYASSNTKCTKSLKEFEESLRTDLIEAEWKNLEYPDSGYDIEASHIKQILALCELVKMHIK